MTKHKCNWQLSEDGAAICLECTTIIGADGLIESLQEEIAALRAEKLTDASALRLALERIAALEKVAEAAAKIWNPQSWLPVINFDELGEALREAGYLKEEG